MWPQTATIGDRRSAPLPRFGLRKDLMATLARWCFRHRRLVLTAWILVLIVVLAISHSAGSKFSNIFSFPATDSSRAEDIVKANFPAQSGDSDQIVVQA